MRLPLCVTTLALCMCAPVLALVSPRPSGLEQKIRPQLYVLDETIDSSDPAATPTALDRFRISAGGQWWGQLHSGSTRAALISGSGLKLAPTDRVTDIDALVAQVRGLIVRNPELLAPGIGELVLSAQRSGVLDEGKIAYVDFDWQLFGHRVEGARVFARINSGNVIQLGTRLLGGQADGPMPELTAEQAMQRVIEYLGGPSETDRGFGEPDLFYLPVREQGALRYRLVYGLRFERAGDSSTWTARVDAHDGEVLAFFDANQYGQVTGGVFPRTVVDPETVVPFPLVQVDGVGVTNSDGRFSFTGQTVSTGLDGRFFSTNCTTCSNPAQAQASTNLGLGWLRMGVGGADASGNGASTKAERNAFYHLNLVRLLTKRWLNIAWLDTNITANVNIADTCNAFWDGTANFYRSGGGCNNTGEIADVMQHEWGHGLDGNTRGGDSATGEGTADHVAMMITHSSIIGPYFRVSGSGVRQLDKSLDSKGTLTSTNATTLCGTGSCSGPLGRECHCEGEIYGQTGWDLAQALVSKHGVNTGWWEHERIFFNSLAQAGTYTPNQADSIYDAYLAADDDNGNLADGTPNGAEIFNAFNAHGIAGTARSSSAGCSRPAQPVVSLSRACNGITATWGSVSGATQYKISRRFGTSAAFLPVATVSTTSYTDTEVSADLTYEYVVQAVTSANCPSKIENAVSIAGPQRPEPGIVTITTDDTPAGNRSGTVDPGEAIDLTLTLENGTNVPVSNLVGTIASTTPGITIDFPTRSFADLVGRGLTSNSQAFRFSIGSGVTCGTDIAFTLTLTSSSGCTLDTQYFTVHVGVQQINSANNFDAANGWALDTAASTTTAGAWVRGVPDATTYQPGADSDDSGTQCWFTGTNFGGEGTDDVDNGETVLLSPIFDLTTYNRPIVSYQRWFANRDLGEDAGDFFRVEVSTNGGTAWTALEVLGTNQSAAAWTKRSFDLRSLVTVSANMRFRVRIADGTATGNLIEGAFDDFKLSDETCDNTPPCFVPPTFGGLSTAAAGPDCAESSLSWGTATSNCQNASISYRLYRSTSPSFTPSDSNRIATGLTTLSRLDTLLTPGTAYYYVARAFDSRSGEDANLLRRTVVAPATPDTKAPIYAGLATATSGAGCGETVLSWAAAQETCSTPVVYEVYRSTDPAFTPNASTLIGRTTDTSLVDAALTPKTNYTYLVRAVDKAGLNDGNAVKRTVKATVLAEQLALQDFEAGAAGWARSGLNDAATGLWELGDPAQTDAQPGTCPSGTSCWATGLAGPGLGDNDIDTGTTTLVSAPFSLVGATDPAVRYKRYYSNNAGAAPGTDTWLVEISNNDGAAWSTVESTTASNSNNIFSEIEFPLGAVAPTAQMRLRFTASDLVDGSVVEAVVDDFRTVDLSGGCDACSAAPRVSTIAVTKDASDVVIDWTNDPVSAGRFKIYRSSAPSFSPSSLLGTTSTKSYRHLSGTTDGTFTAYLVSAVNACSQEGPLN